MRGRPPKSPVIPSRKIWVDADTCPSPIMDILFRVADKRRMILTLVASRPQRCPESAYVRSLVIATGPEMVNSRIAAMLDMGDLVVTSDAPLAQAAAGKKASSLSPRGEPSEKGENFSSQLDHMLARMASPTAGAAAAS